MAGHSQFKNIMHRKGRQDKARSMLFGKLAREITVSAKLGLPDPSMNARLRAAILAGGVGFLRSALFSPPQLMWSRSSRVRRSRLRP